MAEKDITSLTDAESICEHRGRRKNDAHVTRHKTIGGHRNSSLFGVHFLQNVLPEGVATRTIFAPLKIFLRILGAECFIGRRLGYYHFFLFGHHCGSVGRKGRRERRRAEKELASVREKSRKTVRY
jgi:hypothetical protein